MGYSEMSREERIRAAKYVESCVRHAQRYRNCPIDDTFIDQVGGVKPLMGRVQQVECLMGPGIMYSYSFVVRSGVTSLTAIPQSVTAE